MPSIVRSATMVLDIFCSNKRKSTPSSHHQPTNIRQEISLPADGGTDSQQHRPHHETLPNVSNISWRYVTEPYRERAEDEISVERGDVVAFVRNCQDQDGKEWSYIIGGYRKGGYVPSHILKEHCIKPKVRTVCDTRTTIDLHQHSRPQSHKTHCTSERTCHSNGCIKPNAFDLVTNSAQGSSGCQTFHKFPDIQHVATYSPYYNNCMASHPVCNYMPFLRHEGPNNEAIVSHIFIPREENDLEVRPSDRVRVLNTDDPDWYWVRRTDDNHEGFVPSSYMVFTHSAMLHQGNSTATMRSSNQNDFHTYINQPAERKSLTTDQNSMI